MTGRRKLYAQLEREHEMMRKTLEIIAADASDKLQATQARGTLANIGPDIIPNMAT